MKVSGFFLIFSVLFLLPAAFLFADVITGEIVFLEGGIEVSREGQYLNTSLVDIGLVLEEFDLVETGPDGYVEIKINVPQEEGSHIKIIENTAFYFSTSTAEGGIRSTDFRILRGSMNFRVFPLESEEMLQIYGDDTVLGVRGTTFNVDTALDRSLLITVPEGKVACTTSQGTINAEPGTVVTSSKDTGLRAVAVEPEDLELYRRYWTDLRLDALKINARLSTQFYASQWDQMQAKLVNAMTEVEKQESVFRRWEKIMDEDLPLPDMGQAIKDKHAVNPGMGLLRSSMPYTERVLYTLINLEEYHAKGYGQGSLQNPKYSNTKSFYQIFSRQKDPVKSILLRARYYIRIYRFLDSKVRGDFPSGGIPSPGLFDPSPFL